MHEAHSLMISDLHLNPREPWLMEQFVHFLNTRASRCEQLYILGDLFASWLGKDINIEFLNTIRSNLQAIKAKGTEIYFIRGNRDFLLTDADIQALHMQPLKDPCVVELYGVRWLLSHGDRLCTLDRAYQRYRKVVNIKLLQCVFLKMPQALRFHIATRIHQRNPHKTQALNLNYMLADIDPHTLLQELNAWKVPNIVHGHTHRLGLHWHSSYFRIALGDWRQDYFNYLYLAKEKIMLQSHLWP